MSYYNLTYIGAYISYEGKLDKSILSNDFYDNYIICEYPGHVILPNKKLSNNVSKDGSDDFEYEIENINKSIEEFKEFSKDLLKQLKESNYHHSVKFGVINAFLWLKGLKDIT